jgi:hypothetical protein
MKPKKRGHFCWSCGQISPNERFSGEGHARDLCRGCSKLGAEELEYRQAVRDIAGVLQCREIVPRRERPRIERYLQHPNERVRAYVADLLAGSDLRKQELRAEEEAEERMFEELAAQTELHPETAPRVEPLAEMDLQEIPC